MANCPHALEFIDERHERGWLPGKVRKNKFACAPMFTDSCVYVCVCACVRACVRACTCTCTCGTSCLSAMPCPMDNAYLPMGGVLPFRGLLQELQQENGCAYTRDQALGDVRICRKISGLNLCNLIVQSVEACRGPMLSSRSLKPRL